MYKVPDFLNYDNKFLFEINEDPFYIFLVKNL